MAKMTADFPTAPPAYGLEGPSAGSTVEKSLPASHTEIRTLPGEAMPFPLVGSEVLPNYPPDGGQLTPSELASIRETAQPLLPKGKVIRRRSIV